LAHYVGDVHQPLHVGTVYLSATGKRVDPDKSGFDPKTFTTGGNDLTVSGSNMHSRWDAIPASLKETKITAAWITRARAVPATSGDVFTWSTSWATGTLGQAKSAYQGVTFGALSGKHWPATLPSGYATRMTAIKKTQLTAGGAHLAAVLEAIWP
ncbi:MAG TPA: S1/P1 nuclease, partial [Steroidobacteraceae bacterium]